MENKYIVKKTGDKMLTYIINVTNDILAVSVVIGLIMAFIDSRLSASGRIVGKISLLLGVIAAGIRAYITNTRRIKDGWKVGTYGYGFALGFFVLAVAALIIFGYFLMKKKNGKMHTAANRVISLSLGLLMIAYLYCMLPNVLTYPFKFDTGDAGILSTEFLFRLGGYLIGLLICILSAVGVYHLGMLADKKGYRKLSFTVMCLANVIYAVNIFARLMSVLTARKIVDSIDLFNFASKSNNVSYLYTVAVFTLVMLMAIVFWIGSCTKKEPYSNNAQRRKLRSVWRSGKRYSVLLLICMVMGILSATWFVELNKVEIREAPVETPVVLQNAKGEDETISVPIELVSDGHLHRFGYKTAEGNLVRFIVVLKQENTSNYGVGLDACEICGEAGYYENNNGQVVCKKCNVIMNRTTIGMKGGCNPIIIDYDIDENQITVPVSEMVKHQSHFKS